MKKVLVTGGSGFVGANLVRRLLSDGHQVHLLLRPGYSGWRLKGLEKEIRKHILPFPNPAGLDSTVAKIRPDWIFHLAAHGAYSFQNDLEEIVRTNFLGTTRLLTSCIKRGFECFVNAGSSSEYGYKDHAPSENELLEPNSHYAVTKAAASHFCRLEARRSKLKIITLRLYNIYGPYEDPRRFIPTLIVKGLNNKLPPLVDPDIGRDFTHTEDVNDAFLLACKKKARELGAIYNVGTGVQTTIRKAVELARKEMKIAQLPKWGTMPNRKWDTTVWVSNNRKIRKDLGWKPRRTFAQGFVSTVEWFRQNPDMLRHYTAQIDK